MRNSCAKFFCAKSSLMMTVQRPGANIFRPDCKKYVEIQKVRVTENEGYITGSAGIVFRYESESVPDNSS
jgi:hypothetical protein